MDPLFDPADFRLPAGVAHVCAGGETAFLHRHDQALLAYARDKSLGEPGRHAQDARHCGTAAPGGRPAPRAPIQVIDTAMPISGADHADCTSFRAIALAARKATETRGQPDRRHTR